MSSPKSSGPRVKHCARATLPNAIMQAPPPPRSDLPTSIDVIPTSTVMLKSAPLPPPPRGAPAKKKHTLDSQSPFFPGVYGRPLFMLTPVNHFSSIPDGKSIIFNYFRKALPHEIAEGSSYILVDVYENLWTAPEVFLKWREAVDSGVMKEPEKAAYRYSIAHIRNEYRLYCSLKKDSIASVRHPIPPPYSSFPKASDKDDDEEEGFPADDSESDSDSEFKPDK